MLNTKRILLASVVSIISTASALAETNNGINRNIITMPANNAEAVNIDLNVADGRDFVRIDDRIEFCFTVSKAGYISLWDLGTSGKVSRIYPFQEQNSVRKVEADKEECVGNQRFKVTGPTGTENVVLYWTRNSSDQIEAAGYRNNKEFVSELEASAKNAVKDGSWDDWATANIAFEIIGENDNASTTSLGNIARTRNQYDNVYIIAFGSNVTPLKKTNDDAKLFINMAKASLDVPSNNIRLYEDAYRSDFEDGFEWVRNQAGENDLVLFFYSGHGSQLEDDNGDEVDGMDEALVPYDIADEANLNRADKYIRDDELKDWFNSIKAGAVVSVFDSCYSGGMYKGFSQGALLNARSKFFSKGDIAGKLPKFKGGLDSATSKDGMARDIVDDGLGNGTTKYAMLSAAQEGEFALEMPNEGGVFTTMLRDSLQSSNPGRDWKEMSDILSRNVNRITKSRQTPVYEDPDHALNELKFD